MASTDQPVNPHLTDPNLRPVVSPSFSPTDYLNATLPSTRISKQQHTAPSLSAVASQTQSHLSALNAQTLRLTSTLTGLTDEILRTGSRLAYEVELLRGEALSLADTLSSRGDLHDSIIKFVPGGLDSAIPLPEASQLSPNNRHNGQEPVLPQANSAQHQLQDPITEPSAKEPEALPRLRTLLHVRAQLQTVIQRFNLALSFPLPPSLLTTTASSLISVNPPNQDPDLESKGLAALSRLRQEVLDLLADAEGRGGGADRARERVAELRELCAIWKGTGEEKTRTKWVDGLEQMVDDEARKKEEGKRKGDKVRTEMRRDASSVRSTIEATGSGPGFLRRLKDEIYME